MQKNLLMSLQPEEAKRQVEQLMGRLDAVRSEIARSQRDWERFKGLNQLVEAREAEADLGRLQERRRQIEAELGRLKKYW
jgi:archaellum component FlaC